DHRMAPRLDRKARLADQGGRAPLERGGPLGQRRERVEPGERGGSPLKRRESVDEPRQYLLVQLALARERLVARAEHPVLEALELGGDEALGGAHRLAADVVLRYPLGVAP